MVVAQLTNLCDKGVSGWLTMQMAGQRWLTYLYPGSLSLLGFVCVDGLHEKGNPIVYDQILPSTSWNFVWSRKGNILIISFFYKNQVDYRAVLRVFRFILKTRNIQRL